jgi:hypothetical protein
MSEVYDLLQGNELTQLENKFSKDYRLWLYTKTKKYDVNRRQGSAAFSNGVKTYARFFNRFKLRSLESFTYPDI